MPMTFDPWQAAAGGRHAANRKKALRLVGNEPGKAHALVKVHDWRGRAVHVYHLVKGERRRVNKPDANSWGQFTTAGTAVDYPPQDHRSSDLAFWVEYGKRAAAKLGLQVAE